MWCLVKFVVDKSELVRPLEFFENFDSIKLELHKEYHVFWSKDDLQTPDKLLKKEGKILHVDSIKKGRNSKNPIPGYYRAILLQFADTEDSLEKALEGKRVPVPVQSKSSPRKESFQDKSLKEELKDARKRNLSVLNDTNNGEDGLMECDDVPVKLIPSSTENIGDGLKTKYEAQKKKLKTANHELDDLKRKNKRDNECKEKAINELNHFKAKYEKMEEELQILRSLNLEFQRKFLSWSEPVVPATHTPVLDVLPKLCDNPTLSETGADARKEESLILIEVPNDLDIPSSSNSSSAVQDKNQTNVNLQPGTPKDNSFNPPEQAQIESDKLQEPPHHHIQLFPISTSKGQNKRLPIEPSKTSLNNYISSPTFKGRIPISRTTAPSMMSLDLTIQNCMLSQVLYQAAKKSVKIGPHGDSQFTKNLAEALWTRETLALRTVTGAPPRKKGGDAGDIEEDARPACSPLKKACLKQLFEFRMDEEEVEEQRTLTPQDRSNRSSKINKYLKAKIGTVRSQLGLK